MLSISIMGHPKRNDRIKSMMDRLSNQISVAKDHGLDVDGPFLALDHENKGPWLCHKKAMGLATRNWHLVLQDDVIFCSDLPLALCKCIESINKEVPISLFSQLSQESWTRISDHWVTVSRIWAQAIVTPEKIRNQAIQWLDNNDTEFWRRTWRTFDDIRFETFFRTHQMPIWVPTPNLVDHSVKDTHSLLGHESSFESRMSKCFIGTHMKGCDIDWKLGMPSV